MPTRLWNTIRYSDTEQELFAVPRAKMKPREALKFAAAQQDIAGMSRSTAANVDVIMDAATRDLAGPRALVTEYWQYDAERHDQFASDIMSLCGRELLQLIQERDATTR